MNKDDGSAGSTQPAATPKEAALEYARRGFSPIPIWSRAQRPDGCCKQARITWKEFQTRAPSGDEVLGWFSGAPSSNVGLVMGRASGMIAIDVDSAEALAALRGRGPLPMTLTARTAKGWHFIFRHPGRPVQTRAGVLPGVDVRGDGGYIVVWPSIHESGHLYTWEGEGSGTLDTPVAELPEWLADLLNGGPVSSRSKVSVGSVAEGTRNDTLTRLAGSLFRSGASADEVRDELARINQSECKPPLDGTEVEQIVASIAARERKSRSRVGSSGRRHPPGRPDAQSFADIQPVDVDWLWPGYIPYGKLTMLLGDPGLGKSTLALNIGATLTTGGTMPDGTPVTPGGLIVMSGEDGMPDTVVPRFIAMGGDRSRASDFQVTRGEGLRCLPVFPDDLAPLQEAIVERGVRMVIIDPLVSFLAATTNSWSDQHVRGVLTPLAQMAAQTGAAVVAIMHLNKREGASMDYRGGGSIAFVAAARSVMLVDPHPHDPESRIVRAMKSNLSAKPQPYAFHTEVCDDDSRRLSALIWDGPTESSVRDQPAGGARKLHEAKEFLLSVLKDGPVPSNEVAAMAEVAGISKPTLDRASKTLHVLREREGAGKGSQLLMLLPVHATNWRELREMQMLTTNGHFGPPSVTVTVTNEEREERAAILEYDGGFSKRHAEFAAGPPSFETREEDAA